MRNIVGDSPIIGSKNTIPSGIENLFWLRKCIVSNQSSSKSSVVVLTRLLNTNNWSDFLDTSTGGFGQYAVGRTDIGNVV